MNVMTRRGSLDNIVTYEHVCDTAADLLNIPIQRSTLGSTAIVLRGESGDFEVYIANSNGEWMLISMGSGGSGSSGGNGGTDTSQDTVTAADLLEGVTAHNRNGQQIIGEIISRTITDLEEADNSLVIPAGYYNEQIVYTLPTEEPLIEKDVNLYDYDGTLLYSYYKNEFLELQSYPTPRPKTNTLVFVQWNWDFEQAQEYVRLYGQLDIGAVWDVADGGIELDIEVKEQTQIQFNVSSQANLYIQIIDPTVGMTTRTYVPGGELPSITLAPKNYTIKFTPLTQKSINISNQNGTGSSNLLIGKGYCITELRLGHNTVCANSTCYAGLPNLKSIILPMNISTIGDYELENAIKLKCLVIPRSVTSIYSIHNCPNLTKLLLSSTVVQNLINLQSISTKKLFLPIGTPDLTIVGPLQVLVGDSNYDYLELHQTLLTTFPILPNISEFRDWQFSNNGCLQKVTLASTLQSIEPTAFDDCPFLTEFHFLGAIPPTLTSINTMRGFTANDQKSKVIFYIPRGSLQAYRTATNWATLYEQGWRFIQED